MSDLSDNQIEIPENEIINDETKSDGDNDNNSLNNSVKVEEVHDDHIDFDVSSLNNSDMCDSDDDRDIKDMLEGEVVRKKISIYGGVNMNTSADIKDTIKEKYDTAVQVYHEPPENVTCQDVVIAVNEFYNRQQFFSAAFDLISTYVKGQKVLYTEAHEHCTLYLNMLMLPAILLSALASVFSFSFEGYEWGSIVVASINAFNGFLLSVVNYSKLDAASEAHRISSHQYDKLQSMCEFTSGCLLVLPYDQGPISKKFNLDSTKLAIEKLKFIEGKIKDIKETNNFIIPNKIRSNFMNIYYTNIFSLVKVINETESKIIIDMKNLINKSKALDYKIKCGVNTKEENDELLKINSLINQYHKDYIDVQRAYSQIDEMFKRDVEKAERRRNQTVLSRLCCMITCWYCCGCCRKSYRDDNSYTNANDILKQVSNIQVRSNKKMFFKPDHTINIHKQL